MKDYIFKGNLIIDGYLSDGDKSFKVSDINKEMVEISYHYLKELRDNGELNPGTFYRIIDYVTTTSQIDTKSAEHQFDVIVLALTNNSLSEEAWACKNDRDTYFENCNLGAWKLWYSLDNDTDKFAWALDSDIKAIKVKDTDENITFIYVRNYELDEEGQFAWTYLYDSDNKDIDEISDWTHLDNPDTFFTNSENVCIGDTFEVDGDQITVLDRKLPGTGVIYRMIDEFENEAPYDFKNIMYAFKNLIVISETYYGKSYYERCPEEDLTGLYAYECIDGYSHSASSTHHFIYLTTSPSNMKYHELVKDSSGSDISSYTFEYALRTPGYTSDKYFYTFSNLAYYTGTVYDVTLIDGNKNNKILLKYNGTLRKLPRESLLMYSSNVTTCIMRNNQLYVNSTQIYDTLLKSNGSFIGNTFIDSFRHSYADCNADFSYNSFGVGRVKANSTNDSEGNLITANFFGNVIGNSFKQNIIKCSFENNTIGRNFQNNKIGCYTEENQTLVTNSAMGFSNNNIGDDFAFNIFYSSTTLNALIDFNTFKDSVSNCKFTMFRRMDNCIFSNDVKSFVVDTSVTALNRIYVDTNVRYVNLHCATYQHSNNEISGKINLYYITGTSASPIDLYIDNDSSSLDNLSPKTYYPSDYQIITL